MAAAIRGHVKYNAEVASLDVTNRTVMTTSGKEYQAEYVITTIPWDNFEIVGLKQTELIEDIGKLKHTGVEIAYFPDSDLSYHRILSRKAFCHNGRGYWTETNLNRVKMKNKEYVYCNKYAYPLNTLEKPEIMKRLLAVMKERQIYGQGRWGEHEHYNSDVVERAMNLAEKMIKFDK